MNPIQRQLYEKAAHERSLVCEWLLALMKQSPEKPATKDVLRQIAIQQFNVSKHSFDAGWDLAIMKSGNEHWWNPLPRSKTATQRKN